MKTIKRYTLPTVTRDGQKISVGVSIDAESLRRWLYYVRSRTSVCEFDFRWSEDPRSTAFKYYGGFCAVYRPENIYIRFKLCMGTDYEDVDYPLDEFWRMVKCVERPSFGMCVTVKV